MKRICRFIFCSLGIVLTSATYAEHLPRPDHVVVVIEENHSFAQIMNMQHAASTINALATRGMLFTQSYGVTHPSLPNYLALFSGSTQGVTDDACPYQFSSDNLASALHDKGLSFASYAENLPAAGDLSCSAGAYQRKHNPAADWQGSRLDASVNLSFKDFPQDFAQLPTIAFVIPDQSNDMHDGSFEQADAWLKKYIEPYVEWAFSHNSLLILTWDEDDRTAGNHIATILVGPMVKHGSSAQRIDHYNVLRTLLDFYQLPAIGASRTAPALKTIWNKPLHTPLPSSAD